MTNGFLRWLLVKLCALVPLWFVLYSCTSGVEKKQSRLANASSPYLLEHADNPVDWYEWGPDALAKAKNENKPLIISIGYASCHWCHVMERESFMDTAVARIMNENFVSIKIDREERPDIDQIYINAAQLISGNAGWPLNAFALPDGKPFYAATYFPKDHWIKLLQQINSAFRNERQNLQKQAEAITKGVQSSEFVFSVANEISSLDQGMHVSFFAGLQSFVDEESGGLKGAPKFPMPVVWEFLLQFNRFTKNPEALELVNTTLNEMAKGGIFDQLGGGFARYSTDENWKVPHFEKMLYDNAQLVSLYVHAYQLTRNPLYEEVITETLEFVERELTSPEGGFYSSINADSEGEEGNFYLWTNEEIINELGESDGKLACDYFQVADSGNWNSETSQATNILHRKETKQQFAEKHSMTEEEWGLKLLAIRKQLFETREKRIRPTTDNKILTAWNALMLNGFVDAFLATGNADYLEAAIKNARFLEKNLINPDGKLQRNFKDGRVSINAFLDDYALLAQAFINLYQSTLDTHWLEQARNVAAYAINHFRDEQSGLFYYTSDEAEALVVRKMELTDNVIPSSNSIMADVLYRLGEYYGNDEYIGMSNAMLSHFAGEMASGNPYYSHWASLVGIITHQPYEVAIVGEKALELSLQMQKQFLPDALFMGGAAENLPLLENKLVDGQTIIYVCRNKVCRLPVKTVEEALKQLE